MIHRHGIHDVCTMTPSAVPNYIIRMMVAGVACGTAHGAARGWAELKRDVPLLENWRKEHVVEYLGANVAHDALYGILFGPWAPILVPASLFGWPREQLRCDWIKRTLRLE